MYNPWLEGLIKNALEEDVGSGDLTSCGVVEASLTGEGKIYAREAGVVAGLEVARKVFQVVDPGVQFTPYFKDGDRVERGDSVALVSGALLSLLTAERTALNFLQRMSGIASVTREFCDLLGDSGVQLLDTRKTTPGLRFLEKYAVRAGGGRNHRFGLYDGVLIKENHILASGGVKKALQKVKGSVPVTVKIEIEVTSMEQLREALQEGADIIMLDNWDVEKLEEAVRLARGKAKLEVSGEVTRERLKEIISAGVDYVSSGYLTHTSGILNFSFLLLKENAKR